MAVVCSFAARASEQEDTPQCGVVPPPGWAEFDFKAATRGMTITPIVQAPMSRGSGRVQLGIQEGKPLSFEEFKAWGEDPSRACPAAVSEGAVDWRKVERRLWSSLSTTAEPPRYGSDNLGTLFGKQDASGWNINALDTELQLLGDIPGVTRSMLYFGTSVFAWHTEDVDLFSLNLLHFGAPKFWYSVGPEHAGRLEQLAAAAFPDVLKETRCRRFLRHKTTMLSPEQLKRAGIPFVRAIQRPGDIMLTYAGAYHAGFNTGFNCAESANFVAPLWWPQGEKAVHSMCICRPDHVRINLAALRQAVEAFMQRGGEERWSRAGTACQAAASAAGASGDCESAAAAGAASFGGARGSSSAAASDEGGPKPWDAGSAMAIAPGKARQLSLPELPPSTLDLGSADNFGGFVRFRDEVIEAGLWGWGLGDGAGAAEAAPPMTGSLGRSQIRVAKCLPGTGDGGTEASQPGSASSDVLPLKQLLSKLEPWRARLLRETLAHCNADGAGAGSRGGRTAKAPAPGPPAVWVKWTDGSMFSGRAIDYGSGSVRVHYPGYDRGEDEWHCIDGDAIAARAEPSNYCWRRPAGWMAAESFMEVTVAKGMGPPGDLGAERDRAAQEAASLWAAQPGPRLGAEAFADRPPNWRNMLWRVRV
ncbi:Kdm4a, partial [Symbiodinium sp. KB8]